MIMYLLSCNLKINCGYCCTVEYIEEKCWVCVRCVLQVELKFRSLARSIANIAKIYKDQHNCVNVFHKFGKLHYFRMHYGGHLQRWGLKSVDYCT